jgi:hypothetical protein
VSILGDDEIKQCMVMEEERKEEREQQKIMINVVKEKKKISSVCISTQSSYVG